MKKIITILAVCLLLTLAACNTAPQDVPRAQIQEESTPEPTPESTPVEEPETVEMEKETAAETAQEAGDLVKKPFTADSTFEFQGFKVGRDHLGVFEDFSGNLHYDGGELVGADLVVQADSVKTDTAAVDKHLKTDDFFDVEKYQTIEAASTSFDKAAGTATGDLTFHGVTKEVTFPVTFTDNSVTTDFMLDTTPFGMKYIGVNKEVRIFFTLKSE